MLRNVAAAAALIEIAMVRVHIALRSAEFVGGFDVVDERRPRIVRKEGESLAEALLRADEAAVISRVPDRRIDPGHVAELRKRTQGLRVARPQPFRGELVERKIIGGEMMAH